MSTNIVTCTACQRRNRVPASASGTPACAGCHTALPWIVSAGDDTFSDLVEQSPTPVLVDFWAPWCAPCRAVGPALEQVARDLAGEVKLVKVNVDHAPGLSRRFQIGSVPTLMVFRRGKLLSRRSGAAAAPTLRAWVRQSVPAKSNA